MSKIVKVSSMKEATFSQLLWFGKRNGNLRELYNKTKQVQFHISKKLDLTKKQIWNEILFPFYAFVHYFNTTFHKPLRINVLDKKAFCSSGKAEEVLGCIDITQNNKMSININYNCSIRKKYNLKTPSVTLIHELIHYTQEKKFLFSVVEKQYSYETAPHEIEARHISQIFIGKLIEETEPESKYNKTFKKRKPFIWAQIEILNSDYLAIMKHNSHKNWLRRTIATCLNLLR